MSTRHHILNRRTIVQKVCIGLGIFFIVLGLVGMAMPGLAGMHLSLIHNMLHLTAGAFSIWSGYSDDPRKGYLFSMGFGFLFAIVALGGFFVGEPGYPGVGYMEADNYLLRIIPNALEFGSVDHVVHLLVAVTFMGTAYVWKSKHDRGLKSTVRHQARTHSIHEEDIDSDFNPDEFPLHTIGKNSQINPNDFNRHL